MLNTQVEFYKVDLTEHQLFVTDKAFSELEETEKPPSTIIMPEVQAISLDTFEK